MAAGAVAALAVGWLNPAPWLLALLLVLILGILWAVALAEFLRADAWAEADEPSPGENQPEATPGRLTRRLYAVAMTHPTPYAAELEAERVGWYEMTELVRSLTPTECLVPGYYRDPDWTVRDAVAHLGTWLAEAAGQLERLIAGTYEGHDVDIDALNAVFLAAMQGQPWDVAWVQANAGRSRMLQVLAELREPSDEAAWWIGKAGRDHYGQHLPRLREWVAELLARRST